VEPSNLKNERNWTRENVQFWKCPKTDPQQIGVTGNPKLSIPENRENKKFLPYQIDRGQSKKIFLNSFFKRK